MAAPQPTELASSSLVQLAASQLRKEILSGVLAPGERIVEGQLTQRFGTSRAPLREALRLLGEQGLVEHLPRRGVRVVQLSDSDVDELFELRGVLERFAVQAVLLGDEPLDMTVVDAAMHRLAAAAHTGDAMDAAEAHRNFHMSIIGLAGRRQLELAYEPIVVKLQLYMAANLHREAQQRDPSAGVERHRRLRDALARGDVGKALHEIDAHGARSFLH